MELRPLLTDPVVCPPPLEEREMPRREKRLLGKLLSPYHLTTTVMDEWQKVSGPHLSVQPFQPLLWQMEPVDPQ